MLTDLSDDVLKTARRTGRRDAKKGLLPRCKTQGQGQTDRQASLKRAQRMHRSIVEKIGRNPTLLEWAQVTDEYESGYNDAKGE